MRHSNLRNMGLLVLTAFIWGVAFVAQSEGGDAIGPYSFSFLRFLIGSFVLLPAIAFLDKKKLTPKRPTTASDQKLLWKGGICCGIFLCLATNLQQMGIYLGTSSGKAGFLTACYIVFVPVLGIFLKKKCGWNIWIGVFLTLIGLYLLCMKEDFSFQFCDLLVLLCAVVFAFHILVIDYFSPLVDGVRMSCIQFFVAGILSFIPMFFFEMKGSIQGFSHWGFAFRSLEAWIPLLYAGVLSCGVAYTLQIIGQQNVNPTIASLIFSLESVFSVLAGWLLLKESLSSHELIGCLLIFCAIILAQLPLQKKFYK